MYISRSPKFVRFVTEESYIVLVFQVFKLLLKNGHFLFGLYGSCLTSIAEWLYSDWAIGFALGL